MPPQTLRKDRPEGKDLEDVVNVDIVDIEKRREMQKYYVYVIEVTLRSKRRYIVYRRYNQFNNLCNNLEERFPIEAGQISSKDRVLPSLPKKKFIGRSAIRDVAKERLPHLTTYLQTILLSLPRKIARDPCVEQFIREKDYDTAKPYKGRYSFKRRESGSSQANGDTKRRPPPPGKPLPSAPRSTSGTLPPKRPVSGPPVPSTRPLISPSKLPSAKPTFVLPPKPLNKPVAGKSSLPAKPFVAAKPDVKVKPSPPAKPPVSGKPKPPPLAAKPIKGPRAQALYNYEARQHDELSFTKGDMIKLRQRRDEGWIEGEVKGKIGIVPVTYIEIIEDLQLEHSTDEWDTEDWDSGDDDDSTATLSCFYKGKEREISIPLSMISNPSYSELLQIISAALGDSKIALNYKDKDKHLVHVMDDSDMGLLVKEGIPKPAQMKSSDYVSWNVHATTQGDLSVYSVEPRRKKKK
eukprot:m.25473 g.25473  ORF g.25473 m.25473 type:complete len:464 (+) comp28814_c0_seq1:479-1870(+)